MYVLTETMHTVLTILTINISFLFKTLKYILLHNVVNLAGYKITRNTFSFNQS